MAKKEESVHRFITMVFLIYGAKLRARAGSAAELSVAVPPFQVESAIFAASKEMGGWWA